MKAKRYAHDCDQCTYLGRHGKHDLYFCKSPATVIARYSQHGPDYAALEHDVSIRRSCGPLKEASIRAVEKGLTK